LWLRIANAGSSYVGVFQYGTVEIPGLLSAYVMQGTDTVLGVSLLGDDCTVTTSAGNCIQSFLPLQL
jgi:hypothetical protein